MLNTHNIDLSIFGLLSDIADSYNHNIDSLDGDEIYAALETISENEDDFSLDFDGNEYRIIKDYAIWDIYVDAIKDIVNDCYDLKLDNIPHFVAFDIDWEKTAKNTYVDGYGHTFASYDGEELATGNHWVFRTN